MARSSSYTYDPKTGNWTKGTTDSNSSNGSTSSNSSGDNLTSTNSDSNSSTGSVEKQYNYIEINTLSGTLNFIVTEETIKLKAGDTVKLKGLGKYLSGDYYVKDITRQISSNGYSHSATLIKTDFGTSLKSSTSTTTKKVVEKKPATPKKAETKIESTPKVTTTPKRYHTVQKGDSLWAIAKKYYGNGALYTKIFNANKMIKNANLIYVGQRLYIP